MIAIKVLGLLALVAIASGSEVERILGGVPARNGQAAHLVLVRAQYDCAGALLSTRWVITAARCFAYSRPEDVHVRVGSTNGTDGTWYGVKKVINHPKFTWRASEHNIAVVQTIKAVVLIPGRVRAIILPRQPLTLPSQVWTVGIRAVGGANNTATQSLTRVESLALTRKVCLKRIKPNRIPTFYANLVCAQPAKKGSGTCGSADVGAPLSNAQNSLVGINSWSSSCGGTHPDVFTLVHPYLSFIRNATGIHHQH